MTRITALALLALATPAVTITAVPSSAGTPVTCHGRVATIVGTAGDDRLTGTPGDDVIAGLGGSDVIRGLAGHDTICGGLGWDFLSGGRGDDVLDGGRGPHGSERGGDGNDRIVSASADNTMIGGRGNDTSLNLRGNVRFEAGPGDDTMVNRGEFRVVLDLSSAPRGITADLDTGRIVGDGRDHLDLGPATSVNVVGSPYDDTLLGSSDPDWLQGLGGDDVIRGRGGADDLSGGRGHNRLWGGPGPDSLTSNGGGVPQGRTVARGGPGADRLSDFGPGDDLFGGPGDDQLDRQLRPGSVAVTDGGPGATQLTLAVLPPRHGSAGWHRVIVDLAGGTVRAGGLTSPLSGHFDQLLVFDAADSGRRADSWVIDGTDGDDVISADVFRPATVHAGAGDDTVTTGDHDDTLYGGPGTDLAFAGDGTDTCFSIEGPIPPASTTSCETSTP